MKYLQKSKIFKQLLLEKRIGQISANIEVVFGFDIVKTTHAEKRKDVTKRDIGGSQRMISNAEMKEFVSLFKKEISQGIISGDIVDETNFVIKSVKWELAMVLIADKVADTYWKLIIRTVFRESEINQFRVGSDQVVYEK